MSSFVGRARELAEIGRLLTRTQLVTLTGPPGSGKTRLALEAAAQQRRTSHPAPVLVDVDAAVGPSEVYERITSHFPSAPLAPSDEIRAPLLVLDGCDRQLEACGTALLVAFSRVPGVRVLTTSRESLRCPGEVVCSITGLTLPDGAEHRTSGDLSHVPAVQLFLDRARAVRPDFRLTPDNADQIAALCVRLDGLPLAVELAAQLVGPFTVAEIHEQLDRAPLQLLTRGWRTAAPRQRSLEAAVDWSYDPLTEDEKRLFRAFAVTPGGCELDLAMALTGDADSFRTVPQVLASLREKSLITTVQDVHGGSRFHMSQPLRWTARQYLVDAPHAEKETVHERAAAWFGAFLAPFAATGVLGRDHLRRLAQERANLDDILSRLTTGDNVRRTPMAAAVETFDMLVVGVTGRSPTSVAPPTGPPESRDALGARSALAVLAAWQGGGKRAVRLARQVRADALSLGDDAQHARMDGLLGLLVQPECGDGTARSLRHCLAAARLRDDMPLLALTLYMLAHQVLSSGQTQNTAESLAEALSIAREDGLTGPLRALLLGGGALALDTDDPVRATSYFTELLNSSAPHPSWRADALEGLALVAVGSGAHERALTLLAAADRLRAVVPQTQPQAVPDRPWWARRVRVARAAATASLPGSGIETAVAAGRAPNSANQAADRVRDRPGADGESVLSAREWQVAMLVAQGLTNRQIADQIYVSPRTIDTHIRNIRIALGLLSRAHIAAWVVQSRTARSPAVSG